MRKITLFTLLLVLPITLWAIDIDYRVEMRAGGIMNDGKVEQVSPNRSPVMGGEVALTFHPDWAALKAWNGAGVGCALAYYDLGDHSKLGHAIAPYAFADVPIVKKEHFILGVRLGVGLAFVTKTYFNTIPAQYLYKQLSWTEEGQTQYANQCIGSVTNFHFPEALYIEVPLGKGWSITAGGGWYHISNGSTKQPNSGYNFFTGSLGARYTPPMQEAASEAVHYTNDKQKKRNWELEMSWVGAGRQVYYKDQQTFLAMAMQVAGYWRAHDVFRLGGGVDVFYDGSYIPRDTKFGKTNLSAAKPDGSDCWRIGMSIQPELVMGKFSCGFHFGIYLLDGVKELEIDEKYATDAQKIEFATTGRVTTKGVFYPYNMPKAGSAGYPDGWMYTQIVVRYHLPYHIFVQGSMKAHLTKVEFVGVGIGAYY